MLKFKTKKYCTLILSLIFIISALTACASNSNLSTGSDAAADNSDNGKLNVTVTLFPYYDFVRQIAGDKVNLTMVVPAGMDTHSFEPTPSDMVSLTKSDLIIYNGGSLERWMDQVLESLGKNTKAAAMIDYVDAVEEEIVEGMETDEEESHEEGTIELDEHIWTSPVNVQKIAKEIGRVLGEKDPDNAKYYEDNVNAYIKKLKTLDSEIKEVVDNGKRKTIVFGDKFPIRYFADQYGLEYSAAFAGCSSETEPSADTLAFLINKVKEENIPVVFHIELSSEKIADTICEATGAKKLLFHSCHNITKEDFDSGVTYLSLMEENVKNLKAALN